jgi:hypothetical protein
LVILQLCVQTIIVMAEDLPIVHVLYGPQRALHRIKSFVSSLGPLCSESRSFDDLFRLYSERNIFGSLWLLNLLTASVVIRGLLIESLKGPIDGGVLVSQGHRHYRLQDVDW